jgi:hypothetical protein
MRNESPEKRRERLIARRLRQRQQQTTWRPYAHKARAYTTNNKAVESARRFRQRYGAQALTPHGVQARPLV